MIELARVTKEFDGKRKVTALAGVDLTVERGEMVSLVGPSGSGKSTLLNLIGTLDRPTSGVVRVDGVDVAQLTDDDRTRVRRDKIGFIFQFFNLLPSLSALENVALPLHLRGWDRKKAHNRAAELLDLVRLGARVEHLPDEMSGGERQRTAIARALSVYPPILLADEPTGNLDSRTSVEIIDIFQRLNEGGLTVAMVTHEHDIAQFARRVLVFRDGKIRRDEAVANRPRAAEVLKTLPTLED